MSTKNDDIEASVTEIKNKIEDYESTIRAGQSFISLVTWENSHKVDSSIYSFGRRMNTSGSNLISKNDEITPDIVIQRQHDLGYVVEIKKSLTLDRREWEDVAKQIIKYDDVLTGWWNLPDEKIKNFCVVLLIHMSRSRDFTDFFVDYLNSNSIQLKNPVSIVEFTRSDERIHYYLLRKQYGQILDENIDGRLYSSVPVPIEKVITSYGNHKFCDCEPPVVEYTMSILWQDIFNSLRGQKFDSKLRVYPIDISVNQICEELQKLYGSRGNSHRDVEFPRIGWVKAAMSSFVDLGYAIQLDEENYRVLFRLIRDDLISNFVSHRKKPKKEHANQASQLELFNK